ncbi:MAG: hypothetical protein F6K04_25910 [Leptolyngbya sp. SIO4C5]|nr:hypothetical protein [Leptolyngbya sp. SIO4C5]
MKLGKVIFPGLTSDIFITALSYSQNLQSKLGIEKESSMVLLARLRPLVQRFLLLVLSLALLLLPAPKVWAADTPPADTANSVTSAVSVPNLTVNNISSEKVNQFDNL